MHTWHDKKIQLRTWIYMKNLLKTKLNIKRTLDNITNLRDGLNLCMTQTESNEIAIKPAGKGSIVAVMISKYYQTMCQSHLNNEQEYWYLFENNPSLIVNEKIINYKKKKKTAPFYLIMSMNILLIPIIKFLMK